MDMVPLQAVDGKDQAAEKHAHSQGKWNEEFFTDYRYFPCHTRQPSRGSITSAGAVHRQFAEDGRLTMMDNKLLIRGIQGKDTGHEDFFLPGSNSWRSLLFT